MNKTSTFVYVVKLARPELHEKMSKEEEAIVDEHFERLKIGVAEGKVILAGPCLDKAFGIVVFQASSEKEAYEYMKNDPAVKKGIMTAELHPFRISLLQKG